ncbi:MAG TPA: hypothetical protein VLV87_04590 [Gammaproteobacteria bacterium]|nr:hypothetical protein [Gammaproteobacteria bacterium]
MYPLKFIVKYLMVAGLGLAGVLSLGRGFGLPIPFLEYGSLEAWNVIAGAGLLTFSLCVAFFWRLSRPKQSAARRSYSVGFGDEWLMQTTITGSSALRHRSR